MWKVWVCVCVCVKFNKHTPAGGRVVCLGVIVGHRSSSVCLCLFPAFLTWRCSKYGNLIPFSAPYLFPVFITMTNMSDTAAASTLPAATAGSHVRPSRCTITQGTTHCTCEPGYTISGRDSNVCTGVSLFFFLLSFFTHDIKWVFILLDIDECELFHHGQAGRLCLHACVNTPGGYRCSCPAGYNLTRDGRSCKGVNLSSLLHIT